MINILNSFLAERTFQVNVEGHLSPAHPLENGVPPGSVLSVTLFLVAIQPIFRVVPNSVQILLYDDDILLLVWGKKDQSFLRKLQSAVKAVDKCPNARREPTQAIKRDGVTIPTQTLLKTLGVTLDRPLNFKAHCKMTKKACESRLRILKMIGAKLPRSHRASLLQIGSAIVTSRLLYGMGLVSRGADAVIQILAADYNGMIRFASGAYVTSPILASMAEAEVVGAPLPNTCSRTRLTTRKWYEAKPQIVWDVKKRVKAEDPSEIVRPIVQELLTERFSRSTVVYTDGSKDDIAVGAGVFGEHFQQSIGLPPQCSVFFAEAFAIRTALTAYHTSRDLLLVSDSAGCLSAMEAGTSQHPCVQEIENMLRNRPIKLCWIPGHAGMRGNEEADRLAGEVRGIAPLNTSVPGADAVYQIKTVIRNHIDQRPLKSSFVKSNLTRKNTYDCPGTTSYIFYWSLPNSTVVASCSLIVILSSTLLYIAISLAQLITLASRTPRQLPCGGSLFGLYLIVYPGTSSSSSSSDSIRLALWRAFDFVDSCALAVVYQSRPAHTTYYQP
ncbi:uncharacterized protein LOC131694619 [Topomyia yanbarensis]|uniref:uncharacterized protein LOC131694619 n=1 Tax=Topomyia yanbarensis TaxID=2498891 RepID=UPI00273C6745|nr:uncharacterized protein LOC131694619 [Topomyia yanbarensis]